MLSQGKPQMALLALHLLMSREWIPFSDARSTCVRKLCPQLPVCSRPGVPAALKLCPEVSPTPVAVSHFRRISQPSQIFS